MLDRHQPKLPQILQPLGRQVQRGHSSRPPPPACATPSPAAPAPLLRIIGLQNRRTGRGHIVGDASGRGGGVAHAVQRQPAMRAGADAGIVPAAPVDAGCGASGRPRPGRGWRPRRRRSPRPRAPPGWSRRGRRRGPRRAGRASRGARRGRRRCRPRWSVGRARRARPPGPAASLEFGGPAGAASGRAGRRSGRSRGAGRRAAAAATAAAGLVGAMVAAEEGQAASSSDCTPSDRRLTPASAKAGEAPGLGVGGIGLQRDLEVGRAAATGARRPVDDRADGVGVHQRGRAAAEEDRDQPARAGQGRLGLQVGRMAATSAACSRLARGRARR